MMFNNYFSGSYEYILRLYLIVSCLIVFGLITLYSISNDPTSLNSTFFRQILFIFFSFFVFLVIQQINVKTVHDYSTLIYIGSFFLSFCLSF